MQSLKLGAHSRRLVAPLAWVLAFVQALTIALALALPAAAASAQQAGRPAAGGVGAGAAPERFWNAIELDDVERLQTEMLRGASANARHPEFGPAIVVAARERSPRTLAYLAQLAGTAVDATGPRNETALMLTALHGDLASARLLVARGAEVNRAGWTPLHYAAAGGHVALINYLLEQHAYIDAESPNGTTPLMMAARHKHTNVVRTLLEAGADPTLRNEAGLSAADYLAANGEAAEAQWLRERAAEFVQRYGTVENPRWVGGAGPAAPGASGAVEPPAPASAPPPAPAPAPAVVSPVSSPGVQVPEPAGATPDAPADASDESFHQPSNVPAAPAGSTNEGVDSPAAPAASINEGVDSPAAPPTSLNPAAAAQEAPATSLDPASGSPVEPRLPDTSPVTPAVRGARDEPPAPVELEPARPRLPGMRD